VALTIFFGVYPAPILDATAASVDALVGQVTASIEAGRATAAAALAQ